MSSRLEHKGRENENRPSEICSKNSRPISSSRSKTDEMNRFRVDQIIVIGVVIIIQQNAVFLRHFYLFELYTYSSIYVHHRMSWEANNRDLQKALFSWQIDYIVRLVLCMISSWIFERTIWIVSFRLGIFRRTISNRPSKNLLKKPHPSILRT